MLEFIRATVDDLDAYMIAKIDAFSDDFEQYGFGPSGYDNYEKEKYNILHYPTYKIVLDGTIIGGITCCEVSDGVFWLGGIYIQKQYQNIGIGTKAITFIESEFPNAKKWKLHTPYKNYRNHHFYEKVGYQKIGETPPREDRGGFYLFEYEKNM